MLNFYRKTDLQLARFESQHSKFNTLLVHVITFPLMAVSLLTALAHLFGTAATALLWCAALCYCFAHSVKYASLYAILWAAIAFSALSNRGLDLSTMSALLLCFLAPGAVQFYSHKLFEGAFPDSLDRSVLDTPPKRIFDIVVVNLLIGPYFAFVAFLKKSRLFN
jgi:hypothetical protein